MNIFHEAERIYIKNEQKEIVAFITFPSVNDHTVCVDHTFVDEDVRDKGLAGKLMDELVHQLKDKHLKASITCSYAADWFEKHAEYGDLLVKS